MTSSILFQRLILIRKYSRLITIAGSVMVLVVPLVLFYLFIYLSAANYDGSYTWDSVVLWGSLQDGTFWLWPGHAIFQDSMRLGGGPVGVIVMFIMGAAAVGAGIAILYRMLALGVGLFLLRRRTHITKEKQGVTFDTGSSILTQLLPHILDEENFAWGNYTVNLTGRCMVVQTSLQSSSAQLFFDSMSNDIEKREGNRLVFAPETELVFDATTLEHFRIYAPKEDHADLTHVLTSDVLALLVKELSGSEIIWQDNIVTVIIDIRSVNNQKDLDLMTESLARLVKIFEKFSSSEMHTLTAKRTSTRRLFGVVTVRSALAYTLMYGLVTFYLFMVAITGGTALAGDLVFVLALVGIFQVIGIHRLLKHRMSSVPAKDVFSSEWNSSYIASRKEADL